MCVACVGASHIRFGLAVVQAPFYTKEREREGGRERERGTHTQKERDK